MNMRTMLIMLDCKIIFTPKDFVITILLTSPKAKKEFGFEAKTDFREGLKKTVDWFRKNMRNNGP